MGFAFEGTLSITKAIAPIAAFIIPTPRNDRPWFFHFFMSVFSTYRLLFTPSPPHT